jgi:hypothetical protein
MRMRARHKMSNPYFGEEELNFWYSPPHHPHPVILDNNDFPVKQTLNKSSKFLELCKDFRFKLNQIDLSKFAKIINKTHIVFFSTN